VFGFTVPYVKDTGLDSQTRVLPPCLRLIVVLISSSRKWWDITLKLATAGFTSSPIHHS